MRLKSLYLLFGLALCAMSLVNCSRESSIKENVNLRNNHSVVFIYRAPFENPDAFADSIINLSNPDSVIVSDTITVTVGDTIYMMGFLRYNSDKIYLYQWILDSLVKDTTGKGKDKMKKALVTGRNATPQSWVYFKEGVYSPLFVAVDGNNATDTAGKDQFIRVINTPPYLGVPKDTLWTRAKSPVTFPILALDSFGTIKSFKVDLDAGGKREAKDWKYEKSETSDSLLITIPYDSTLTDSLGNQKIYIIVTDDDKNTTKDSVYLHFNQLPTIKILGPDDQQRISDTVESFRLFYEGHDKDNEDQLRYYVRVAATPDNQESDLNLSNVYDLVLKNSTATSFAVIEDGENALKKLGFTGRYFSWDVWVTDGYDTVVAEKIKIGKNKQRPRFFYLGPSKSTCDFTGTAKFEGLSTHRGIKITLVNAADSNNIYTAETDENGSFRASGLPAGTFRLTATDETGRGFVKVSTRTPNINAGDEKELPPILLKDPAPPNIYAVKGIEDTIATRNFVISGKFSDFGSQVKTAKAVLDKDTCSSKSQVCSFTELSNHAWSVNVKSVPDGDHSFRISATDSAGYRTDSVYAFVVAATKMVVTVDDASSAITGKDDSLTFKAKIEQANPPIKKVYWKYRHKDSTKFVLVDSSSVSSGAATIKLPASKFKKPTIKYGDQYVMYAESDNGSGSNEVRFVFIDSGPMAIFQSPRMDTVVTPKDTVLIKASVLGNNTDGTNTYKSITWTCLEGKTASANCLSGTDLQQKMVWTKPDTMRVILSVTNMDDDTAVDTLRVIVIADPPTVTIDEEQRVITKKVKSSHTFDVSAKDKYGYIKELAWKCANDASYTAKAIADSSKDTTVSLTITNLPANEVSNYRCIVRATDDDDQKGYDTLFFNVIKDPPIIQLNIHKDDVTIKDEELLKYSVTTILGGAYNVETACHSSLPNIWTEGYKGPVSRVVMPDTAGDYYCVMRAADNDDPSLFTVDTVHYSVFWAPPTVTTMDTTYATINDTLVLYANAQDSAEADLPGGIVLYEWGCGLMNENVLEHPAQNNSATYRAVLPSTAYKNYKCVVRVTDTDGLTAKDSVKISVELGAPTVQVARKTGVVRSGFNIVLDATASDWNEGSMGRIVKREWSCGPITALEDNWKTVSSYDTTWSAPQVATTCYCVARATDDDGNIATDTMKLTYSNETPVITVENKQMYVAEGEVILLNASINKTVWEGVSWYSWQCFYSDTKQPADSLRLLDYYQNGERFYDYRENLSSEGRDVYCVVSAQEQLTQYEYRDTTRVFVLTAENRPVGKITAADTIYPWSGDEAQQGEARYYYTPEWGGMQSQNGTLGDNNARSFYWMFSNVGGGFYTGSSDGSLDTGNVQFFNEAFRRPVSEGDFTVGLVFWDSTSANPTVSFKNRHQADTTYRTIHVRRAWRNLSPDTVLDTTSNRTAPAITVLDKKLVVSYVMSDQTVMTKTYDGSSWGANLSGGNIAVDGDITALRMTNNNSDLYLAVLTSTDKIYVYKSAGGVDSWRTVGTPITGAKTVGLTCRPSTGLPVVTYVESKKPRFSYWNGSTWTKVTPDGASSAREASGAFTTTSGIFVLVFTDTTSKYNAYYSIFDQNLSFKKTVSIGKEIGNITVATDLDNIYLGYMDRSLSVKGPRVRVGSVTLNGIDLISNHVLKTNMYLSNLMIAARGTKAYVVFDDEMDFAFCHAFAFDGTNWQLYGENKLPYFEGPFYDSHGYNLFGGAPEIAIASDGMVYISMRAHAGTPRAGTAPSRNKGPIVMKNVSKNWVINTK